MIRPFLQPDTQWIRALGAVVAGLLVVGGAAEVGDLRLRVERPAHQLVSVAHCLVRAALRDDGDAPATSVMRQR